MVSHRFHLTRYVDGPWDAALVDLLFSTHVNKNETLALLQEGFEISVGDLGFVCKWRGVNNRLFSYQGKYCWDNQTCDLRFITTIKC